ncbi:MAG: MarR family transcriptional regulator [Ruminococcaceae bacterium]|nr:MarR family transcriptional regulator [Oscillospiraceae bacterium]
MSSCMRDLKNLRYTKKLHDSIVKDVCEKYDLGRPELDIISFLYTYDDMDVASDIVEHCGLSKANVSQAVERLLQKGLVTRTTDSVDRRKQHLLLTDKTDAIVADIEKAHRYFSSVLIDGLSEKELDLYRDIARRMCENAMKYLERN